MCLQHSRVSNRDVHQLLHLFMCRNCHISFYSPYLAVDLVVNMAGATSKKLADYMYASIASLRAEGDIWKCTTWHVAWHQDDSCVYAEQPGKHQWHNNSALACYP